MKSMTAMNATRKQAGFTIIELVVVILLLGILTATALPRFMDVTDEAHDAVVDAVEGGFATGSALFRAQWVAEGQPLASGIAQFNSLFASSAGYPIGLDADIGEVADCIEIYENILQQGGRPSIKTMTVATPTAIAIESDIETLTTADAGNSLNFDFYTAMVTNATPANATTCNYYYVGQHKNGNATNAVEIPVISFNFTTGAVTRTKVDLNS